jgi:hypothetical protein
LEIGNRPGGGVAVRIAIPFRRQSGAAGQITALSAVRGELITSTD